MSTLTTSLEKTTKQSYAVAVVRPDEHAFADPETITPANEPSSQFRESHPSLFMPKHKYKKYKMKAGRDQSGLKVLKEKPMKNS